MTHSENVTPLSDQEVLETAEMLRRARLSGQVPPRLPREIRQEIHNMLAIIYRDLVVYREGNDDHEIILVPRKGELNDNANLWEGLWSLPGSVIYFGDKSPLESCRRISMEEIGIDVENCILVMEHYWVKLIPEGRMPVSNVSLCKASDPLAKPTDGRYFSVLEIPFERVIPEHGTFIQASLRLLERN